MTATASPQGAAGSADGPSGGEMTLFEHLSELRDRLFKSALALVLGFCVGFVFRAQVIDLLKGPYCNLPETARSGPAAVADGNECALIVLRVLDGFFISLKAAAVVAILIAGPVICYQIWRFITPGLYPAERRYAIPFVLASFLMFVGGAAFSYFVLPRGLAFLLSFAGEGIIPLLAASEYLDFILFTMLSFGLAFQFPLALILFVLMGVVTADGLRQYRRHAMFGTFVAAAIITPTGDPLTMTAMAGPLILFYEVSILVARFVERRRRPVATS